MKLSEAIRRGARRRPQAFAALFAEVEREGEQVIGSCAWGAAYEGVTGLHFQNSDKEGHDEIVERLAQQFPAAYSELYDQLCDMNDSDRLTREEIADFVERAGF